MVQKNSVIVVVLIFVLLFSSACGSVKSVDVVSAANDTSEKIEEQADNTEKEITTEVEEVIEVEEVVEPEPELEPEPEPTTIVISVAGDAMLASFKDQSANNGFKEYAEREEPHYFFDGVSSVFGNDDFTVVNLENVFTDNPNRKPKDKPENPAYWYKSTTKNTAILTQSSIDAVSLANNHSSDYGWDSLTDTIEALDEAGVLWGKEDTTFYYEKDGFRIAFICNGLWYDGQQSAIINRLKAEEENGTSDFQIVYYHGGKERIHEPEQWKIKASRQLVDAGADVVLGNHPHVLQPMEVYNGADIVYSLGNFCFGGSKHPENRTIIYQVRLTVSPEKELLSVDSEIIPCYVYTGDENNYQPMVIEDEEDRQKVLDFMEWKRSSPL